MRIFRHHDHVGAERDIRTAGHRKSLHLADHGPLRTKQAHELVGVVGHTSVILHRIPRHVLRVAIGLVPGGVSRQVVSGAEGAAGARQHDHMRARIVVGTRHRVRERTRQLIVDRIHDLRPVQRDARDATVALVEDFGHVRLPRKRDQIFAKSPWRPLPPAKRAAPLAPSLKTASTPLVHSCRKASRTGRP
jgi:hypothetical protein